MRLVRLSANNKFKQLNMGQSDLINNQTVKFVISYCIVFKQVEVSTILASVESTGSLLHADTVRCLCVEYRKKVTKKHEMQLFANIRGTYVFTALVSVESVSNHLTTSRMLNVVRLSMKCSCLPISVVKVSNHVQTDTNSPTNSKSMFQHSFQTLYS